MFNKIRTTVIAFVMPGFTGNEVINTYKEKMFAVRGFCGSAKVRNFYI